jgi:hypothetical protein
MSALNRRSILAGAAAAPIAALAGNAIAAPTSTDSRLLELECQAAAAETAAKEAGSIFCRAEKAMFAWERRNPKPKVRNFNIGKVCWDGPGILVSGSEAYARYWKLVDEANADSTAALNEHSEAVKRWEERRSTARANCRYDELEVFYEGLIDRADAFRDEAASISATTIDGLQCKARMLSEADLIAVGGSGLLAGSIIDELRAMTGRQEPQGA